MNMIEILETIKEPHDEEDLWPEDHNIHNYLFKFIPEDKKTLFNHLKDEKSLETLGDVLLMMLDSGGDDFFYAIDEMIKYRIEPIYLYEYIGAMVDNTSNAKQKKALKQYDVPFFINVTSYMEQEKAAIHYKG